MSQSDGLGLRLAEFIGALSLAVDLGLGQPTEHVLRSSLIGLRLADRLGLDEEARAAVYYAALIAWVGCHADSYEQARWYGDDIAAKQAHFQVDMTMLGAAGYLMRNVGAGQSLLQRARVAGSFMAEGRHWMMSSKPTHCMLAGDLADSLGLGEPVREPLQQTFERWDGKGLPDGVKGDEIALAARIVQLADAAEFYRGAGGVDAAIAVAQERRGTQFDPELVDTFCAEAGEILAGLDGDVGWDDLIDAEPGLRPRLTEPEFDAALEAVADFIDLKSPYTIGHSSAVAELISAAGAGYGLPQPDIVVLRRAALMHDLGRLGVSNAIWDKPGSLSPAEMERVRMHPYLGERVLAGSPVLAALGALVGQQQERLDGSGYPRGLAGSALAPETRLLAAADVYRALRELRPHRPARDAADAETELRDEVRLGRLDGDAVNAVLGAAGHRVRRRREWPAGLTPREVEVLRHLVLGLSNSEIAESLVVSRKTVANHVASIYMKTGQKSRAGASLFAMRHGLVEDLITAER